MSQQIIKPTDLRALSARYTGRCHNCRFPISIGDSCFYSPRLRKIGCQQCWGPAIPRLSRHTQSGNLATGNQQNEWQRFCSYLRTCLLAEAGESILDFNVESFPTLSGSEVLLCCKADSLVLTGSVVDKRLNRARNNGPRDFLYGWPTVVVPDGNGRTKVAPLFVLSGEAEKDSENGTWTFRPKSDPDLNIALLSGRIFDPATAAEVDGAIDGSLEFGNYSKLIDQIQEIALTLGLECYGFDQASLQDTYSQKPGIYNCALLLDANDNGANRDLLRELELLARKTDWMYTAAASLFPKVRDLTTDYRKKIKTEPVCGPLLLNRTQEEATESSRHERITVVTGPPGTGKSQLVVSAVANAWLDQETVLVTSTNNGAVDVAVSRANSLANGLLTRTGNKSAREVLPSIVSDIVGKYKDLEHWSDKEEAEIRSRLALSQIKREKLHRYLGEVENLDTQLTELVIKVDQLSNQMWSNGNPIEDLDPLKEFALGILRLAKAIFFKRLRLRHLYSKSGIKFKFEAIKVGQEWANTLLTYIALRIEVETLRQEQLSTPNQQLQDTDDEWVSASQTATDYVIKKSIQNNPAAYAQLGNVGGAGGKLVVATSIAKRALRGWACTTLSMSKNFALDAGYFDLVIIDEASQCNIAHVLPIAYRAKRMLIVGDPNQLPPIVQVGRKTVDSIADLSEMGSILTENSGLDFLDGSAYFGYEKSVGTDEVILLNEHYRCHPKIARWFNQAFYGNSLTVMTDISTMHDESRGISWIDVKGVATRPPNQRSWINVAEVDEALEIIRSCISKNLSIGVVSPFSAQANAIARSVENEFSMEQLTEVQFSSGTAHRFQGDERELIIFSSCIAPGINEGAARWVEKERNLINVAVSRARQQLVVLGTPEIISQNCPTLSSLRSFILDVNRDEGKIEHRVDSESESRLLQAMFSAGLSTLAKIDVEGFELDFAIFADNRKINIEVDGDQHYDANRQQCRQDILRDRVLTRTGWEVLRFPAWRCFVEPEKVLRDITFYLSN